MPTNRANGRGAKSVTRFAQSGSISFAVISKFKEMYDKPSAVLADWLHVSERTAKRKINGYRRLSDDDLGRLIRSEQGFEFITAIMAGYQPTWWHICEPLMDAADIRKMQMAAQKRIKKILGDAIDADQSLSASIARADALAFYGSEQAGVHADALRSMARPPLDRSMASRPKR
jgi:hypothetical protein